MKHPNPIPFLKISNLVKRYGDETILKKINLEISQGEFLVLLGPSGCGKSTLLNCITGLTSLDNGTIALAGKPIQDVHPSKRNLAMVFQSYALYPNMSVRKNISFGMQIRKMPKLEIAEKITQVANLLKITEHLTKKPSQLSGGQRQRVAIARALVRNPEIFLFDEPLSNLDAKLRLDMRTELKKLHARLDATIIYVTHDQIEALTLASRIAIMVAGEIIQFASPDTIYHRPQNIFVARFIGSPPMNIFPATLAFTTSNDLQLEVQTTDTAPPSILPFPTTLSKTSPELEKILNSDRKVLLGLRPEFVSVISEPDSAPPHSFPVQVELTEPIGSDIFISCSFHNQEITIRIDNNRKISPGDRIYLIPDQRRALLFHPENENRLT